MCYNGFIESRKLIMARQTADARRLAEQATAKVVREAHVEFQKTVPAEMYKLQVLAAKAKVTTRVVLVEEGFMLELQHTGEVLNTFSSEKWEFEEATRRLNDVVKANEALEAERALAASTLKSLSPEQLAALKKFGLNA